MAVPIKRQIVAADTTLIGAGATRIGSWIDAKDFKKASLAYSTDSTTTQALIEQCNNTSPGHVVHQAATAVGAFGAVTTDLHARYVRMTIAAGANAQTRLDASLTLSP